MKNELFDTDHYCQVQEKLKAFLNEQEDFLSGNTINSTRAAGDAIQEIIAENFQEIAGAELCVKYSADFARRAMADLAFEDCNDFYYVVDVKTHRTSTKFNMPNLTSVERLARFYQGPKNYFVILMVSYDIDGNRVVVSDVKFTPIEFLDWNCLTIGALGWGQIQIANANIVNFRPGYSRRQWMLELCDTLMDYYPKEITKITSRIDYFTKVRDFWLNSEEH